MVPIIPAAAGRTTAAPIPANPLHTFKAARFWFCKPLYSEVSMTYRHECREDSGYSPEYHPAMKSPLSAIDITTPSSDDLK
jgi:hypothetical protein